MTLYFLYSGSERGLGVSVSFRIQDKLPELWDPMTGDQRPAEVWKRDGRHTNVALRFDPNGSAVVVFASGKARPSCTRLKHNGNVVLDSDPAWFESPMDIEAIKAAYDSERDGEGRGQFLGPVRNVAAQIDGDTLAAWEPGRFVLEMSNGKTRETKTRKPDVVALDGPWTISFEPGWDTPASIDLQELKPLSEHADRAVRYYSGTATYKKEFDLTAAQSAVRLNLGKVAVIAEVWCNGTRVGTRWAPPFAFDLSMFVKPGKNTLTVKVTNTWRNQLIYDNTRPRDKRKTWATSAPGNSGEAPSPSGLIGPVMLYVGEETSL